jgi:HK97 gp10 family phage protein
MEITFETYGEDELSQNIKKLMQELGPEKVGPVVLDGANVIKNAIYDRAPQGPTGNLKSAVYAKLAPSKNVAFAGIRGGRAPHAHLVEYGHGGPQPAPAHPFFRPAVDESKDFARQVVINGLKDLVEGAL